jgi:tetratricopeptide (TPR) repeat protein
MTEIRTGGKRLPATARQRFSSILALALLVLVAPGCNKFKSKQLIRQGNAHYKAQQYDEALKLYLEAQTIDPDEVRLDKFVAMGYMALYNPGSTHPKDQEALQKSIEHFKKYLAAKPDDEKAAKYLVTTYMNSQKLDDAIAYFKELVEKHPADAQAVQTIAMLYARKGDYDNSLAWQKKRVELEPNNPEAWYTIGVTCWDTAYHVVPDQLPADKRKQIIDLGMSSLEKAIQLRPDYFEAMLYVNLLYREYAKLENDPAKIAEYKAKADEWQKNALEIRKKVQQKQREEAAAKNPLEAM